MTINDNLSVFNGKNVENYDPEKGIVNPESIVYRINTDYDGGGAVFNEKLDAFVNDPRVGEVTALIFGMFSDDSSGDTKGLVEKLVAHKDKLQQLTHLFINDITYEESEISWINNSDMSPVLAAFPNLVYFRVRGGIDLAFTSVSHENLKTLIVETGGLYTSTVKEILAADLPKLEVLELWLGSDEYGFDGKVSDYETIITGAKFPHLTSLGLKNSIIQDDIAIALSNSPFVAQLDELDLSMGTLSDKGAEALLNSPHIQNVKKINLRHHYLSNEMMAKLAALGKDINLDGQEKLEEYGPFVEVSE